MIDTPFGPAQLVLDVPSRTPKSLLLLGHGAGGGVDAPDLIAVRDAALAAGVAVGRVTQPYRVAGRRSPAPAAQLDAAWSAVVAEVRSRYPRKPLITGGRSSGARVACRTAGDVGAVGVLALAFPLHPPGRPDRSRASELATGVPTLVINGDSDPFGVPEAGGDVELCVIPGAKHDLRKDLSAVAEAAVGWLRAQGWAAGRTARMSRTSR